LDKLRPFADIADFSEYRGVLGRLVQFVRFESRFAPLFWDLLGKTLLYRRWTGRWNWPAAWDPTIDS
jgi:chromosome segregation ATPase